MTHFEGGACGGDLNSSLGRREKKSPQKGEREGEKSLCKVILGAVWEAGVTPHWTATLTRGEKKVTGEERKSGRLWNRNWKKKRIGWKFITQ